MLMTEKQYAKTQAVLLDAISQDADVVVAETLAKLIIAKNPEYAVVQPLLIAALSSVLTALRDGRLATAPLGLVRRVLGWFGL